MSPRSQPAKNLPRFAILALVLATAAIAAAGDVVLKNGTVLNGTATPLQQLPIGPAGNANAPTVIYPILMVSNDLAQYFVPSRQVVSAEKGGEVQRLETFRIDPEVRNRTRVLAGLGAFLKVDPFDEHGRRSLTLATDAGPLDVIQGITQITAEHVRLEGLNIFWRSGMATSSMNPEQLDAILHSAIKRNNPDERLKIVRFYIQAQQFDRAQGELDGIRGEYPEMKDRCQEVGLQLTQLKAQMILDELKLRQAAGQYRLAYTYAQKFPTKDVSASVLKDVREFQQAFEVRRELADKAIAQLGELQASLTDTALQAEIAPIRTEISERLHPDNLDRLDAFLKLSTAPNISASEKLALALSGWVLGSANAVTDLPQAVNLWRTRFYVREYLRTARDGTGDRAKFVERIQQIEGIGPKTIAQMLPLVPPAVETPEARPGLVHRIAVTGPRDELAIAYHVLLPLEYHPERTYPVIVSLHGVGRKPETELEFWGGTQDAPGQAQRHGYIVIAPEYLEETARVYDYRPESHQIVLDSLHDARRRFNIDSDRIYLAGHGAGGDAVFDLAMAHPDLWAGAIPMGGVSENVCKFLRMNGKPVHWYILAGELDRGSVLHNSRDINEMLRYGFDVIYAQYLGGGADSFYAEIHRLFDWMDRCRRPKYEKNQEIKYLTMRASDNHIQWLTFGELPRGIVESGKKAMTVTAKITEGNTLIVDSRSHLHTAWLAPDFVDFEKRLSLMYNGKNRSNEFPKADIGVMLEDFYRRGDRQRLYWAAISW